MILRPPSKAPCDCPAVLAPACAVGAHAGTPRVTHVVESLQTGGLERLVHDLALARGRRATTVACLRSIGPFGENLIREGVTVDLIGNEKGILPTAWKLGRYFRRIRPEVIHCHNLYPFLIGSLAARIAGNIPVIMSKHGALVPETGLARHLIRMQLRRAWAVGVSDETRCLLDAWIGPKGRPARFIPNGIATGPYDCLPDRIDARVQLGYPQSTFVIGIVSRITRCKKHAALLDAFARLRLRVPDALLVIVGDGPNLPKVKARIQELGLAGSVILLGERRDVPAILAGLDVFCLPSEMEGMPMTILEAMAAGLPVVASKVGGIPQMVVPGLTGWLVSPDSTEDLAEALLEAASDPARARRMGHAGRERLFDGFSLEQTLAGYEECYREALGEIT